MICVQTQPTDDISWYIRIYHDQCYTQYIMIHIVQKTAELDTQHHFSPRKKHENNPFANPPPCFWGRAGRNSGIVAFHRCHRTAWLWSNQGMTPCSPLEDRQVRPGPARSNETMTCFFLHRNCGEICWWKKMVRNKMISIDKLWTNQMEG